MDNIQNHPAFIAFRNKGGSEPVKKEEPKAEEPKTEEPKAEEPKAKEEK